MKVLIIFSSSELGGAERSLSRMALTSSDIDFQLGTLKADGPWCEWVRAQGLEPLVFGSGSSHGTGGMLSAVVRLIRYLGAQPVDVLYVCGLRASVLIRMFRFLIPSTKIVHGIRWNPVSDSRLDTFFRLVEKTTGFLVDAWITNSQAAKTTLITRCGVSEDRIQVIYNGVVALPDVLPNFNEKPLEVLTVANLNPRKGHREYLQVIQAVILRVPQARFVFIGRDDMFGAVQRAVKEAGLDDEFVRYEGFQSDVTPWLERARIFVLPSLWGEGCPTSILEAFSFSVPVIAYAIDGVPELVSSGVDGYLEQPGDPALADRIVSLLLDPALAELMGLKGRKKVAEYFVVDACVTEHKKFLGQLVSK